MSIIRPMQCPRCGSAAMEEIGRMEAGDLPDLMEDLGIYRCDQCNYEFDSSTERTWAPE